MKNAYYVVYGYRSGNSSGSHAVVVCVDDDLTPHAISGIAKEIEHDNGFDAVLITNIVKFGREGETELYRRCLAWYAEQPNGERAREALQVYGE